MNIKEQIDLFIKISDIGFTPDEYFFVLMTKNRLEDRLNLPNLEQIEQSVIEKFGSVKEAVRKISSPVNKLDELVFDYRSIFPSGRLPSGIAAKSSEMEVRDKMKWFLLKHGKSPEEILQATKAYVERYAQQGYKYMKNASFFIYREDRSKVRNSALLEEIEALGSPEQQDSFSLEA